MSSWKQTSGISKYNNADKINTNTLAVNKLILKEPYSGIFSIDGGIDVSGLSQFNDIVVNGESVFQGFVTFNQDFAMNGNVRTQNIYVSESAFFNDSAFLHGHNDGLGLNTENANAAFDISTNLINGFNILSSQNENISVLAQNNQQAGIKLGVDLSSAYIHFFHENPISSNSPDARFQYETGGDLLLDVSNNFAVLSSMSVSQRETDHINNENLVIYDASNGDYFELFYNNTVRTGAALSCVSYDASSNTFAYLTTPEKRGFAIGGGAYPDDIDRSMGVLSICDTSDNKIPSQTVISGSDLVKYRTTTGINTLKPHTEQSVLDVNGPIFVNNNDIHNVTGELGFEVYSMSVAFSQRNNVLALGSPYQIADPRNHNRILKSVDYGASWSLIDVPIGVVGVDSLSSIAMFDASNCLMIGENEFVQSSIDGGLTWTKLDAILPPVLVGTDYSNLIMKRQLRPNGKVIAFFTANDMSYNIYTFDISFGDLSLNQYYPHEIPTGLNVLNSIATNDTNLFGAGNAIVSFITTNVDDGPGSEDSYVNPPWVDINSQSIYSSGYTYTHIHAHNDLVVAVGPNIISSSSDNGVSWIDVSFNNIDFTNVYAQDALHAIAVGSLANVWFTEDAGVSWNVFDAYLNASGKSNLISTSVMFNTVVMSDENTVLLSNRIQSYIPGSQLGESNIFNVFAPNFANAANNYVLDASGSLRISENLVVGNNLTSYSGIFENLVINGSINIPGSSTNIFGNLIIGNGYSTSSAPANGIIIEGVVGIGTDTPNPAFAVDISGDSYIDGSQIIGSSYLNATAPSDGLLVEGTVGIGTETPDSSKILHVVGDVRIQGNLSTDGSFNIIETDVTTTEILKVVNDGTGPALIVNQTGLQPVMDVQDDGVSCFYIEDGGNVGLGLTNPNHVLDISGNLGVRGSQILGSNVSYITATAPDDGLLVEGTVGIGLVDPSLNFALDVSGNIGIRGSQILGSNASYITATAPDDGLLVEGSVGIGVLVPTRKLDVSGDFFAHDISTNHLSVRDSQTIGSSYITATAPDDGLLVEGSVGIGTTNPTYTLDISAGTLGSNTNDEIKYARFKSNNYNLSYLDIYELRTGNGGGWGTASTRIRKMIDTTPMGYIEFNPPSNGGGLAFGTGGGDERMTIDGTGNVGIGESTPDFKVHVRGNGPQLLLEGETNENAKLRFSAGPNFTHRYHEIDTNFYTGGNAYLNNMYFKVNNGVENSPSAKMTIRGDGNVGIGTTTPSQKLDVIGNIYCSGRVGIDTAGPQVPLHISTAISKNISGNNNGDGTYYNGVHSYISHINAGGIHIFNNNQYNTNPISIYTPAGYIASKGIYTARSISVSSDRRIKSNISDINDDEALQKLRLFKPCKYTYIDYRENNTIPVYGFIAQEIKEVLPYAVDDTLNLDNEIPNIYRFCNITNDTILSFFDYDNSFDLSYNGKNYNFSDGSGNTSVFEKDLSGNICAIIFKSKNGVSLERKVINIIDENTFEIDCSFNETEILEDNTIFAYGQKVVNFNKLKKDAIWTVATAALQEVDRQLQTEKAKVADLEAKNTRLETQITDILARLDALENP